MSDGRESISIRADGETIRGVVDGHDDDDTFRFVCFIIERQVLILIQEVSGKGAPVQGIWGLKRV